MRMNMQNQFWNILKSPICYSIGITGKKHSEASIYEKSRPATQTGLKIPHSCREISSSSHPSHGRAQRCRICLVQQSRLGKKHLQRLERIYVPYWYPHLIWWKKTTWHLAVMLEGLAPGVQIYKIKMLHFVASEGLCKNRFIKGVFWWWRLQQLFSRYFPYSFSWAFAPSEFKGSTFIYIFTPCTDK